MPGGIEKLTDPAIAAWFENAPRSGVASAWYGHVPFAFWLMQAVRPRIFVELGTHNGISYAAFCQAALDAALDVRCYAVDTWQGDAHAGFYPEDVFTSLQTFHDARYAAFSRMLRTTFDDASSYFADGSVDLLHIDGLHTYDAVKHDFETWLPKLSSRAVVLFHDVNVREREFGVWRLWSELRAQYPGFDFVHSHGLGALAVGPALDGPALELCRLESPASIATIRTRFAQSGMRCMADSERTQLTQELKQAERRMGDAEAAQQAGQLAATAEQARREADLRDQLDSATAEMNAARQEAARLGALLTETEARATKNHFAASAAEQMVEYTANRQRETQQGLDALEARLSERDAQIAALHEAQSTYRAIADSTTWRVLQPVRTAVDTVRAVTPWRRKP